MSIRIRVSAHTRRTAVLALSTLLVLGAIPRTAAQSLPPVVPGFPNVPQTPGTVLSGLNAPEQGRTAIIAYHNGILFTVPEIPSSEPGSDYQVRAWDLSDPTAPAVLDVYGTTPMPINAHGYLKSGDYLVLGPNWPPGSALVVPGGRAGIAPADVLSGSPGRRRAGQPLPALVRGRHVLELQRGRRQRHPGA